MWIKYIFYMSQNIKKWKKIEREEKGMNAYLPCRLYILFFANKIKKNKFVIVKYFCIFWNSKKWKKRKKFAHVMLSSQAFTIRWGGEVESKKKVITVKRTLYIFFENFLCFRNYKNKKRTRAYNKKIFITKKSRWKIKEGVYMMA